MSTIMNEKIESIYRQIVNRNPGEVEFHQAVREVLETLGVVLDKHPEYMEQKLIERICEPERQIIFRVPWIDDKGKQQRGGQDKNRAKVPIVRVDGRETVNDNVQYNPQRYD